MKEQRQIAGIKYWSGDDIVDAQLEVLDPLQKYFSGFGACIIEGCKVTLNTAGTPNTYDISAGIIAVNHADGFKIVKTEAVVNTELPGYFKVELSDVNGAYVNTPSGIIRKDYTSSFNLGAPPANTDLYLVITSVDSDNVRFANALGAKSISDKVDITSTAFGGGILSFRVNPIARTLHVTGGFTVPGTGWPNNGTLHPFALDVIPAHMRPKADYNFICYVNYNTANPNFYFRDFAKKTVITQLSALVKTDGSIWIRFIVPETGIASYDCYVSAVVPLD